MSETETDFMQQLGAHLEFLGYDITQRDSTTVSYSAKHAKYWNFVFANKVGGVLFQFFIGTEDGAGQETLLEYVNDLNRDAVVSRFFIDKDNDFAGEAWWPPIYDKAKFGAFIDAWHHDGSLVARHDKSRELLA
ncbi:hypothetical protein KKF91_12465 [Myxococcota bacterium]|nr:hypothetical protein [Myxococcota bacterium]MBU1431346.1 hypothetical protein [Myxococcota bacterium]MBU1900282.1 hypothetical protein [Myxococcota bacterium]